MYQYLRSTLVENREKVIEHIAAFFAHSRGDMHGPLRLGIGSGFICQRRNLIAVTLPVWMSGLAGGVVSALFSPGHNRLGFHDRCYIVGSVSLLSSHIFGPAPPGKYPAYPLADVVSCSVLPGCLWISQTTATPLSRLKITAGEKDGRSKQIPQTWPADLCCGSSNEPTGLLRKLAASDLGKSRVYSISPCRD